MAKIKFRDIRMSKANKERLNMINEIIEEYQADNYVLTLRQLYYQLVSRDVIPNKQSEYAKLSTLLKEGRMAGIVDWGAIEDRLRTPSKPAAFDSPRDILEAAVNQYALPRQKGQPNYIEVWVEKDALSGVLSRVTRRYHIPILVCRGYSSVSAMFDSYQRFKEAHENGQSIRVLYLGDFDPSGEDMVRDIKERTLEFVRGDEKLWKKAGFDFEIEKIALTMDQIRRYNPPPNPAKQTDPRAKDFIEKNGETSWEVDALKPEVLNRLLERAILKLINLDLYDFMVNAETADKEKLTELMNSL